MSSAEARRQFFEIVTLAANGRSDDIAAIVNELGRQELYDLLAEATGMYWGAVRAMAIMDGRTPMEAFQEMALFVAAREGEG